MIRRLSAASLAAIAAALAVPAPGAAQDAPLSIRNTFRIGDAGVLCTAQNAPGDPRLQSMFDRGYRLTCRDAAGAIGTLVALRRDVSLGEIASGLTADALACGEVSATEIEGIGAVRVAECSASDGGVGYKRYSADRGGVTYLVEGLAGYDPALRLALASVVNDREMPGTVQVAQTEVSDPAAFARVQAGELDPLDARDEAYGRNNAGRFAESVQFFETIAQRNRDNNRALAEALANQGLQQSNLGNFTAAERLFDEAAAAVARSDGVTQRLLRNYRAINALNRQEPAVALAAIEVPVAPLDTEFDEERLRQGFINPVLSEQINRENLALQRLGGIESGLTPAERAELLDAQALAITAIAALLQGREDDAVELLAEADRRILAVRDGRVLSARWLRSEIGLEQALIAESQGRTQDALEAYDTAISSIEQSFPQSPALLAARARKAGFVARTGDTAGAKELYAEVVERSASVPESGAVLRELLEPYFALLAADGSAGASADLFAASQILQRPGVAQTQAILAREMSEGDDSASSLFRLSVNRSREIARTQAEIAQLSALAEPSQREIDNLASARESLEYLQQEQTELLSQLAQYPQYKALVPQSLALSDLQSRLREGEGYYKLMLVGDDLYGLWITPTESRSFPIEGGLAALDEQVAFVRDSIVVTENGAPVTYPYDVERARALYLKLFGPIDAELQSTRHLIFEPDGPMLQLPPQVLIAAQPGVDAYLARQEEPGADPYDYRGVEWLGRDREVSIAVSPRGFIDIREIAPSQAENVYLGLGQNAPPEEAPVAAVAGECEWPIATWMAPISAEELYFAKEELGQGSSRVITGEAFTDTALLANDNLDEYRVLHFATHGLVTAPKPSCPARPALLTSFGEQGSDGLLSFREIFDLRLDADLVILSACDTAGMATVAASRDAGITTGGNYALDGLVRAFVGAGARTVVASHWPVPDAFDATKRLINGMVDVRPGVSLASSIAEAQEELMSEAETSHPFYWAAFIILGDGSKALVPANRAQGEASPTTAAP